MWSTFDKRLSNNFWKKKCLCVFHTNLDTIYCFLFLASKAFRKLLSQRPFHCVVFDPSIVNKNQPHRFNIHTEVDITECNKWNWFLHPDFYHYLLSHFPTHAFSSNNWLLNTRSDMFVRRIENPLIIVLFINPYL